VLSHGQYGRSDAGKCPRRARGSGGERPRCDGPVLRGRRRPPTSGPATTTARRSVPVATRSSSSVPTRTHRNAGARGGRPLSHRVPLASAVPPWGRPESCSGPLAAIRRVEPPRQRGAVPLIRRVTASRYTGIDHARSGQSPTRAASGWTPCRSNSTASGRSRPVTTLCPRHRRRSRSPGSDEPGGPASSMSTGWDSASVRRSATPRCSSPRASTTTTSGSTPGTAGPGPRQPIAGDSTGSNSSSWTRQRLDTVRSRLIDQGPPSSRLTAAWHSPTPTASGFDFVGSADSRASSVGFGRRIAAKTRGGRPHDRNFPPGKSKSADFGSDSASFAGS